MSSKTVSCVHCGSMSEFAESRMASHEESPEWKVYTTCHACGQKHVKESICKLYEAHKVAPTAIKKMKRDIEAEAKEKARRIESQPPKPSPSSIKSWPATKPATKLDTVPSLADVINDVMGVPPKKAKKPRQRKPKKAGVPKKRDKWEAVKV